MSDDQDYRSMVSAVNRMRDDGSFASRDPQNDQCGSRDDQAAPATAALAIETLDFLEKEAREELDAHDEWLNEHDEEPDHGADHVGVRPQTLLKLVAIARATASTTPASGKEQVAAPVVQQPWEAQKPASHQDRIDVEGLKAAIAWSTGEVTRRENASARATTVQGVVGHQAAANHLRTILSLIARNEAAEKENEQLRVAIFGDADEDGDPDEMSLQAILNVQKDTMAAFQATFTRSLNFEARATTAEARNAELIAQRAALVDTLTFILPMAKGYAAANRVGRNAEMIAEADALLSTIQAGGGE